MVGGGGSTVKLPSRGSIKSEKIFRSTANESQKITKYFEERTRNVFISFDTDDEYAVNLLRSQAKDERFDVQFRDYSIKDPFDEKWKTQAKEIMKQTSVTIVMIGPDTANRDAVNWEIKQAHDMGKKVIGMRIHSDKNHPIPEQMRQNNDPVIPWNIKKLKQMLNED